MPEDDLEPFGDESAQDRIPQEGRLQVHPGAIRVELNAKLVVYGRSSRSRHGRRHPGKVGKRARELRGVALTCRRTLGEPRELGAREGGHHLATAVHRADAPRSERPIAIEWPRDLVGARLGQRQVLTKVAE